MFFNPKNGKEDIMQRSWALAGVLFVVAVAIVWRIIYIQHYEKFKGKPWIAQLDKTIHLDSIPSMRGNIYSSDGSLLATSLPYYEMSIDPTVADSAGFYSKIDSLCNNVVAYFGKDALITDSKKIRFHRIEWEIEKKKRSKGIEVGKRTFSKNIRLVSGVITLKQQEMVKTWPFFRKQIKKKTKKEPEEPRGGVLKVSYRRYKPFGTMAERTIGLLDSAGHGSKGIEAEYNTRLSGRPGIGKYEILSDGTRMPLSDDERLHAESGSDIHLTIDVNFQDIAETSLRQTLKRYQADYGCAVVMEVGTGQVKAMANLSKVGDSTYREAENHALIQTNNPGSTFKLATMMAVLESSLKSGKITPKTLLETGNGSAYYRNVNVQDTKAHGTITAERAIIESSNVGMHLLMGKSGFYGDIQKYLGYLHQFKLDDSTDYIINGETDPNAPKPHHKNWDGTSATRLSYGYVWLLTPLQILTFYNAVANGGKWVRPMLLKQIRTNGEIVHDGKPAIDSKPIASEKTILSVQKMLLGVVEDEKGTAHNLKNAEYQIAGKTGTTQLLINQSYSKSNQFNVSFVGYFPANKPKYSCIVVVNHPRRGNGKSLYAGDVAAPVFKDIADRIVGYDVKMHPPMANSTNKLSAMSKHFKAGHSDDLRLIADNINLDSKPKLSGWVEAKGNGNKIKWTTKNADPNRLPDMHGMTLRDALYLLENNGFKVAYQGRGKVTSYLRKGNIFELILK